MSWEIEDDEQVTSNAAASVDELRYRPLAERKEIKRKLRDVENPDQALDAQGSNVEELLRRANRPREDTKTNSARTIGGISKGELSAFRLSAVVNCAAIVASEEEVAATVVRLFHDYAKRSEFADMDRFIENFNSSTAPDSVLFAVFSASNPYFSILAHRASALEFARKTVASRHGPKRAQRLLGGMKTRAPDGQDTPNARKK